MNGIPEQARILYALKDYTFKPAAGHEGGRNHIFIVRRNGENKYVLRISDLGDRSEGAKLGEYFYNTGKALGAIHRLSKAYTPVHPRPDYFDKYNMTYLDRLIPDEYAELKTAVAKRLEAFRALPKDKSCYGLVHFDFSDGN